MCRHERRVEICTHTHTKTNKQKSLKKSCLEGIGDVMMEIRGDKKTGAQVMRAALAGGMVVRLKIVLDAIKDTASSDRGSDLSKEGIVFIWRCSIRSICGLSETERQFGRLRTESSGSILSPPSRTLVVPAQGTSADVSRALSHHRRQR